MKSLQFSTVKKKKSSNLNMPKKMLVPLNGNRGYGLASFLPKNKTLKFSANQVVLKTKLCDTVFITNYLRVTLSIHSSSSVGLL